MAKRRISGNEAVARAQRALDESYYDEDDYRPRYTARSNAPAWTMAVIMLIAVVAFLVWLAPDLLMPTEANAPAGAIGNQAPPAAVRRAPAAPARAAAPAYATPIPGVAQSQAEADAQYQAAIQAAEQSAPPLPLNSAGEPIISQAQAEQQQLSLQLAEQEGAAAADAQLAAQRATANAAALARPPDVSKEDAEQMMHRDLCHVPRANPATCANGLYKPTPVN